MNVRSKGMWPDQPKPFMPCVTNTKELVSRRHDKVSRFREIESRKGLLGNGTDLSLDSPTGQDLFRLFLFRMLEELVESYEAVDPDHIKEEFIDALNYLFTAMFLDEKYFSPAVVTRALDELIVEDMADGMFFTRFGKIPQLSTELLGHITILTMQIPEYFRNRSWMHNAQDYVFTGREQVITLLRELFMIGISLFATYDEFHRFFLAKDNVLDFRLKSKY